MRHSERPAEARNLSFALLNNEILRRSLLRMTLYQLGFNFACIPVSLEVQHGYSPQRSPARMGNLFKKGGVYRAKGDKMKISILIALALILAACSAGGSDLSRNQQKWEDGNISDYRFQLTIGCFCPYRDIMPLTVEVRGGEIVSITGVDGVTIPATNPDYEFFSRFATIDKIFSELEAATGNAEAGDVVVTYDPTLGYPVEANIDYIELAIDDELSVSVSGFEPLP